MRISVFGLGYVGAVSAGCLARDGHQVIGCDIDPHKLALIEKGQSPVVERGMPALIASAVDSGRLTVTDDAQVALAGSELSLLCVGTPSDKTGAQDLSAVRRLAEQLGQALRNEDRFHGFVMRSTVAPGTTQNLLESTLAAQSERRPNEDFAVAFQPEFLREGSSIQDYDQPPYTVIGTNDARLEAMLKQLYGHLAAPLHTTDIRTAEMLKMVANAFHALKITFANEVGRLGQALDVDARAVMGLICEDRQLNISPAYLRPGFAFGGSCLPKDVRALESLARSHAADIPMLQAVLPSNRTHIDHTVDLVLETGRRRAGLFGLSFKSGTDDLRESPMVTLTERLLGKGLDLKIYDKEVNVARLIGANRRYIEESIPHIASLMCDAPKDVVDHADVLIVGRSDPALIQTIRTSHRADQIIIDLVGTLSQETLRAPVRGVCW
ncbi:MAG: nucleotide sugar dehydrogenase [Myxococcota bacterium]